MSFNLKLRFTGLCAFVPKDEKATAMNVLLINAIRSKPSISPKTRKLVPHLPELVYIDCHEGIRTFVPTGLNLWFEDSKAGKPGLTVTPDFWINVIQMTDVDKQAGQLKAPCLSGSTQLLVGRIALKHGTVTCGPLIKDKLGNDQKWVIANRNISPLAREIVCNVPIVDDQVLLRGQRFGKNPPPAETFLDLRPCGKAKEVEVLIKNTCACEALPKEPDDSFRWFYRLCHVKMKKCPFPQKLNPGVSDTFCPSTIFKVSSNVKP